MLGLSCRVIDTWEDVRAISGEWDSLAKQIGSSIALSPTYAEIWWRHYGRGVLAIVECRVGESLVGILPMFISTVVAGIVPVRVAKFLTSDSTIVVLSPPIAAEYAQRCWLAAIEALLEAGAEVISFSPLAGEDSCSKEALAAIISAGLRTIVDRSPVSHTVYNLPHSIDAYLSSLKPQSRKNFKRAQRQLTSMGEYEIRRVSDIDSPVSFEQFVRLHIGSMACRWITWTF
jgi:CelD/BcsL family acetyltransferase involved in cellulose biosynthesis